jgi:hypothetical protein
MAAARQIAGNPWASALAYLTGPAEAAAPNYPILANVADAMVVANSRAMPRRRTTFSVSGRLGGRYSQVEFGTQTTASGAQYGERSFDVS